MFKKEFSVLFREYAIQFIKNYGVDNEYTERIFFKTKIVDNKGI